MSASATGQHDFAGPWALAEALAAAVAQDLRDGLERRGGAMLVVSGGSTPRRFLETLGRAALDWARVVVTLADERWVPPDHPRSNERLLRESLRRGDAGAARFVPLYRSGHADPESALVELAADFAALPLPFDAVVLGMGTDGHCASLFPGGDQLEAALRPDSRQRVVPMRVAGAEEPRVTLTLAALIQTRAMYVHIEGPAKKTVLENALAGRAPFEHAPVARVLENAPVMPQVYWCP